MEQGNLFEKITSTFNVICVVGACIMLVWCCWQFSQNEDLCEVSFKSYNVDEDSIYLSISLCFTYPFSNIETDKYGKEMIEKYYDLLRGKYLDDTLLKMDVENITLKMEDHLVGAAVENSYKKSTLINTTTSFLGPNKCVSFETQRGMKMTRLTIVIRNSVFENGIRPNEPHEFYIAISYPQQVFRAYGFSVYTWPDRRNISSKTYATEFNLKGVEILKKRSKSNSPCSDWRSYDNDTIKRIILREGCTPPYWRFDQDLSLPSCKICIVGLCHK